MRCALLLLTETPPERPAKPVACRVSNNMGEGRLHLTINGKTTICGRRVRRTYPHTSVAHDCRRCKA
jgi:hypothetical protein